MKAVTLLILLFLYSYTLHAQLGVDSKTNYYPDHNISSTNMLPDSSISSGTFGTISISNSAYNSLSLSDCTVDTLIIEYSKLAVLNITNAPIKFLRISNSYVKSVNISDFIIGDQMQIKNIQIYSSDFDDIYISNTNTKSLTIYKATILNQLLLSNCDINQFVLNQIHCNGQFNLNSNTKINYLMLNSIEFEKEPVINSYRLADTLYLTKIKIPENTNIDLTNFSYVPESSLTKKTRLCKLFLDDLDIQRVDLDYQFFDLDFYPLDITAADTTKVGVKNQIFQSMIKNQQDRGYSLGLKKIDLEYKYFSYVELNNNKFGYVMSYNFSKWWSNFGYDKWKIFRNSLFIFLFFLTINTITLKFLSSKVYTISKINDAVLSGDNLSIPKRIIMSIFYTAVIFFGIKLEIDNLHFSRYFSTIYILAMYTIGLICTAFMFNYFVS